MKKRIGWSLVLLFTLAAIAVGVFVGVDYWRKDQEISALRPIVKTISLQASAFLEARSNPRNMTVREFYQRSDDAVTEISKSEISLKSISTKLTAAELNPSIEYAASAKALIRELTTLARLRIQADSQRELADEAEKEIRSNNEYTARFARDRYLKYLQDGIDTLTKMKGHAEDVPKHVDKLQELDPVMAGIYGKDSVIPKTLLDEIGNDYKSSKAK